MKEPMEQRSTVKCHWCGQEIDALDGKHADQCYLFIKGERKTLP